MTGAVTIDALFVHGASKCISVKTKYVGYATVTNELSATNVMLIE